MTVSSPVQHSKLTIRRKVPQVDFDGADFATKSIDAGIFPIGLRKLNLSRPGSAPLRDYRD